MNSEIVAYWLLPAEPYREFFRSTIRDLASRFKAPEFEPHLTLLLAPENSSPPKEVLRSLLLPNFSLKVREVGWSANFTKTLFLRLEENRELVRLIESIRVLAGLEKQAKIDPHLSLIYKNLPLRTLRMLAESLTVTFAAIRFDSVSAMRCKSPTESEEEVRQWKPIAAQNSTMRKAG